MSHLMADGKRVCGKPDGHTGKHYSIVTVQRELDRCRARRETPGPCTKKGCTQDRNQYCTGSYDVRCYVHGTVHASSKRLRRSEEEWARQGGTPYTPGELDEGVRASNVAYRALFRVTAVTLLTVRTAR
jgi:hypothetical protein